MKNLHLAPLNYTFMIYIILYLRHLKISKLLDRDVIDYSFFVVMIYGCYLFLTRKEKFMKLYDMSNFESDMINIIFHLIIPAYFINKTELLKKKMKLNTLIEGIVLSSMYIMILPVNDIYFISKTKLIKDISAFLIALYVILS